MKLLFVCTGNICRSPTAEAVFRHIATQEGLAHAFTLDSAGIQSYHSGEAPDARSCAVAARKNIPMEQLRARALHHSNLERFDLLLAMDKSHYHWMQVMASEAQRHKVQLYLPFSGIASPEEVPDPYYGEIEDFEAVLELIENASTLLCRKLKCRAQ